MTKQDQGEREHTDKPLTDDNTACMRQRTSWRNEFKVSSDDTLLWEWRDKMTTRRKTFHLS